MRDLKTLWGKFIAFIYILSFAFSLVAIIFTVMGMSRWWFVRESVEPSRWIFSTFGLFWGAVLIGLWNAAATFIPPILIVILLRHTENGEFTAKLAHFLCWSFIEAYGVYSFSSSFLDMYNNSFILNLILYEELVYPPLTAAMIMSVANPLFLVILVLSFSIRTARYLKQRNFQNSKILRKTEVTAISL